MKTRAEYRVINSLQFVCTHLVFNSFNYFTLLRFRIGLKIGLEALRYATFKSIDMRTHLGLSLNLFVLFHFTLLPRDIMFVLIHNLILGACVNAYLSIPIYRHVIFVFFMCFYLFVLSKGLMKIHFEINCVLEYVDDH